MPPASTTWRTLLALLSVVLCTAAPAFADDPVTDDDWRDGVSLEDVPTGGVADPGDDGPGRKVPSYIGMCEAADGCDLTEDDGTLGSEGKHATGVAVAAGATDASAAAPAPTAPDPAPAADTTVKVQGSGDDQRIVVSDDDDQATLSCTDGASHAAICGTAVALTAGAIAHAILRNGKNADGSLRPNLLQRQRMRYIDQVFSDEDATGAERGKAMEYARDLAGQGLTFKSFPRSFQGFLLGDPTWADHDRPFTEIGMIDIPEGADPVVAEAAERAWMSVLRYANGTDEEAWGRAQDLADDLAADGFPVPEEYRTWADAHPVPAEARGNVTWNRPDPDDTGSDGHSDFDPDDRWPSLDEDDFDIPRDPAEHRGQDYDGGRINHQDPAADHGRAGGDHAGRAGGADEAHRRVEDDPHRRGEHVEVHRGVSHGSAHPVFHGF